MYTAVQHGIAGKHREGHSLMDGWFQQLGRKNKAIECRFISEFGPDFTPDDLNADLALWTEGLSKLVAEGKGSSKKAQEVKRKIAHYSLLNFDFKEWAAEWKLFTNTKKKLDVVIEQMKEYGGDGYGYKDLCDDISDNECKITRYAPGTKIARVFEEEIEQLLKLKCEWEACDNLAHRFQVPFEMPSVISTSALQPEINSTYFVDVFHDIQSCCCPGDTDTDKVIETTVLSAMTAVVGRAVAEALNFTNDTQIRWNFIPSTFGHERDCDEQCNSPSVQFISDVRSRRGSHVICDDDTELGNLMEATVKEYSERSNSEISKTVVVVISGGHDNFPVPIQFCHRLGLRVIIIHDEDNYSDAFVSLATSLPIWGHIIAASQCAPKSSTSAPTKGPAPVSTAVQLLEPSSPRIGDTNITKRHEDRSSEAFRRLRQLLQNQHHSHPPHALLVSRAAFELPWSRYKAQLGGIQTWLAIAVNEHQSDTEDDRIWVQLDLGLGKGMVGIGRQNVREGEHETSNETYQSQNRGEQRASSFGKAPGGLAMSYSSKVKGIDESSATPAQHPSSTLKSHAMGEQDGRFDIAGFEHLSVDGSASASAQEVLRVSARLESHSTQPPREGFTNTLAGLKVFCSSSCGVLEWTDDCIVARFTVVLKAFIQSHGDCAGVDRVLMTSNAALFFRACGFSYTAIPEKKTLAALCAQGSGLNWVEGNDVGGDSDRFSESVKRDYLWCKGSAEMEALPLNHLDLMFLLAGFVLAPDKESWLTQQLNMAIDESASRGASSCSKVDPEPLFEKVSAMVRVPAPKLYHVITFLRPELLAKVQGICRGAEVELNKFPPSVVVKVPAMKGPRDCGGQQLMGVLDTCETCVKEFFATITHTSDIVKQLSKSDFKKPEIRHLCNIHKVYINFLVDKASNEHKVAFLLVYPIANTKGRDAVLTCIQGLERKKPFEATNSDTTIQTALRSLLLLRSEDPRSNECKALEKHIQTSAAFTAILSELCEGFAIRWRHQREEIEFSGCLENVMELVDIIKRRIAAALVRVVVLPSEKSGTSVGHHLASRLQTVHDHSPEFRNVDIEVDPSGRSVTIIALSPEDRCRWQRMCQEVERMVDGLDALQIGLGKNPPFINVKYIKQEFELVACYVKVDGATALATLMLVGTGPACARARSHVSTFAGSLLTTARSPAPQSSSSSSHAPPNLSVPSTASSPKSTVPNHVQQQKLSAWAPGVPIPIAVAVPIPSSGPLTARARAEADGDSSYVFTMPQGSGIPTSANAFAALEF